MSSKSSPSPGSCDGTLRLWRKDFWNRLILSLYRVKDRGDTVWDWKWRQRPWWCDMCKWGESWYWQDSWHCDVTLAMSLVERERERERGREINLPSQSVTASDVHSIKWQTAREAYACLRWPPMTIESIITDITKERNIHINVIKHLSQPEWPVMVVTCWPLPLTLDSLCYKQDNKCQLVSMHQWNTDWKYCRSWCVELLVMCCRWKHWKDSASWSENWSTQWTVRCDHKNGFWQWKMQRSLSLSCGSHQWNRPAMMVHCCGASQTSSVNARMPSQAVWPASTLHHSSPAEQVKHHSHHSWLWTWTIITFTISPTKQ